ncbi:hypothetical protein PENTCL1PPCAC_3295, partial [Pristionchus entomophagus]
STALLVMLLLRISAEPPETLLEPETSPSNDTSSSNETTPTPELPSTTEMPPLPEPARQTGESPPVLNCNSKIPKDGTFCIQTVDNEAQCNQICGQQELFNPDCVPIYDPNQEGAINCAIWNTKPMHFELFGSHFERLSVHIMS